MSDQDHETHPEHPDPEKLGDDSHPDGREPGDDSCVHNEDAKSKPNATLTACNWNTRQLTIEDHTICTWMAINNSFVKHRNPSWDPGLPGVLWYGVVIQIGDFRHWNSGGYQTALHAVSFKNNGVDLIPPISQAQWYGNQPYWVNLVSKDAANRPDPMTAADVPHLNLENQGKSKHFYFRPAKGGITIWHPTDKGYWMEAGRVIYRFNGYRFNVRVVDPAWFRVEIFQKQSGQWVPLHNWDANQIDQVILSIAPGHHHGTHMGPPQK